MYMYYYTSSIAFISFFSVPFCISLTERTAAGFPLVVLAFRFFSGAPFVFCCIFLGAPALALNCPYASL